jgi:hypothetical protein
MYNPFSLFNLSILQAKIAGGRRYFVRQLHPPGMEPGLRGAFLIKSYEDAERNQADLHMQQIQQDNYAFLYDVLIPEQKRKLETAARQPAGFKIFYAGRKGIQWKPPLDYQTKIRTHIREQHPDWLPIRGKQPVAVVLHEEFGTLFLTFSFAKESETIPFADFEK